MVSFHKLAWAYVSVVVNKGGRKRTTSIITVALNVLTIPQNGPKNDPKWSKNGLKKIKICPKPFLLFEVIIYLCPYEKCLLLNDKSIHKVLVGRGVWKETGPLFKNAICTIPKHSWFPASGIKVFLYWLSN